MDISKITGIIVKLFSSENRTRLILFLGILGMALILLSQFLPEKSPSHEVDTTTAEFASREYIDELEAKLTGLITGIEGVGEARVMVTLESGVEYQYLQEEKRNLDTSREEGAEEVSDRVSQKENVERKYILVETQSGKKQPVLQTQLQPKVQGVVVVCEGADSPIVQRNLIHVVTTALNIPTTRVCVVKIDPDQRILREESKQ